LSQTTNFRGAAEKGEEADMKWTRSAGPLGRLS
jgi:hypothetical protein